MMEIFSYPGVLEVMLITCFLGTLLGILGLPLVLRQRAFTSVVITQSASLGVVLGMLIGINQFVSSFLLAISILFVLEFFISKRSTQDSLMAVLFILMASLSTLVVAKYPLMNLDLLTMNFGNLLAISYLEIIFSGIFSVISLISMFILYKPLFAILNDSTSAKALGFDPNRYYFLYAFLLGVTITFGLTIFGVMLVFSYLVVPGFIALRLSKTIKQWFLIIIILSLFTGISGVLISYSLDIPPGIYISSFLGSVALILWIFIK